MRGCTYRLQQMMSLGGGEGGEGGVSSSLAGLPTTHRVGNLPFLAVEQLVGTPEQ